ncbi:ORF5 [Turkey adenovirus 3]|uniref:Uncharacterized protein n=1 Tax=Turkey adenovirus 3 TaxID=41678 RepID=Q9YUR5_9ADEN|nr:hypothetical protein TaV3gp07 [Turkey adenovirus 3]AAC64543.1 ORF5 [Turkey adenovirus 3]
MWFSKIVMSLLSLVAKLPYSALLRSLLIALLTGFFSTVAFSFARIFLVTYSKQQVFHVGNTVFSLWGIMFTFHPLLWSVIISIEVTISFFSISFVQHNLPLCLEHNGGRGSRCSGGGGMASIITTIGFISVKYDSFVLVFFNFSFNFVISLFLSFSPIGNPYGIG